MDTPDRSVMEGSTTPSVKPEQTLNDHTSTSRISPPKDNSTGDKSTSSFERLVESGSYIDHRAHNDLAHVHSSPARSRRRSSNGNVFKRNSTTGKRGGGGNKNEDKTNPSRFSPKGPTHYATSPTLPLTNKNLQSLLRSSSSGSGGIDEEQEATSPTGIAVDMDQFAHEQRQLARSQTWHNPFGNDQADLSPGSPGHYANINYNIGGDDEFSVNSMEFGESNPSSDHSSDSTSLDDVCYYDYDREDEKRDEWPNLQVMEEYVVEELEEMEREKDHEREIDQVVQSVNFGKDVVHDGRKNVQNHKYSPPRPPPSALPEEALDEAAVDEETPLVDNYKVNELESLDSLHDSFRIRPTPTQPWEKSKDQIPTILNKRQPSSQTQRTMRGQKKGELCRFTYFREDLPETIHAPTICGLLSDDPETSIHDRLVELFRPGEKGQQMSESTSTHHPSHKQQDSVSSSNNNLQPLAKSSRLGNESPLPASSGDSISYDPYWLDILDPTEEEMKVISRTFGIHPLTTEDIFLGEAREKVELFKNYYFICFTSFDVVYERRKQKAKEQEKRYNKLQEMYENSSDAGSLYGQHQKNGFASKFPRLFSSILKKKKKPPSIHEKPVSTTVRSRSKKVREGELSPLNMYIIVFKHAVITFHFSATPHPINVRRRARMLKDYLTVSSDWICYALIDDITDSFAPMIETIETEVNAIEDAILRMHSGEHEDSDDSDSEDEGSTHNHHRIHSHRHHKSSHDAQENVFVWRKRSKSTVDANNTGFLKSMNSKPRSKSRTKSRSSSSSSSTSDTGSSHILGWKRKGDMLRRIGECRKRVMSVLRLLSSKADVIKGFSKRFNDLDGTNPLDRHQSEIAMYLGDIQDHIVTMIGALNHYEKLLARFHSNYLAQINIDMTKVNNDTNDILNKVTILGTIVLPINVVTGLWGMNCLVPGQDYDGLAWFWGIVCGMIVFSVIAYNAARRVTGL
ncbi:MNR2 [Candida metapsilosis]|uniref:MNR2 n=1 Tax=Candida metapsilosis TaxID=273372 RepID=A0A8H7ZH53_9ASCO|nr:MNR2 [Candida metapsilosis]